MGTVLVHLAEVCTEPLRPDVKVSLRGCEAVPKILLNDSSHSFCLDKCHVNIEGRLPIACELTSSPVCVVHTGLACFYSTRITSKGLIQSHIPVC